MQWIDRSEERLQWLSAAGDPLERLAAGVDFELFRPELDATLGRGDRAKGVRVGAYAYAAGLGCCGCGC